MRFPQIHIAESVINRILDAAEGIESNPVLNPPPPMPDVQAQSDALDDALKTPPQPTGMPEGGEGALAQAVLDSEDLISAAVDQGRLSEQ